MTAAMPPRLARLASPATALVFGALMLLMTATVVALAVPAHQAQLSGVGVTLLYVAFGVVGIVVAYHQPRNALGWTLLGVAFLFTVSELAGIYAVLDYHSHRGTWPLGGLAVVMQPCWAPAIALAGLSVLLFPDGHFPSGRWRPVRWAYASLAGLWVGGAVAISAHAVLSHEVRVTGGGDLPALNSPTGLGVWWDYAGTAFFLLIAGSWVAWLAGQVAGYRRQPPERREQLKWLLSGTSVFIVCTVISVWLSSTSGGWGVVGTVTSAGMFGFPISIGVGILKYRLYDIDRIISRTLAYAAVTAVLVGCYAGLVAVTGSLAAHSPVYVAAATLAAAAVFNPLRRRVQKLVDRRFNRARYDADRTIAAFSSQLRDAVELDHVRADLLAVVEGALEPAHASIWVAGSRPR